MRGMRAWCIGMVVMVYSLHAIRIGNNFPMEVH